MPGCYIGLCLVLQSIRILSQSPTCVVTVLLPSFLSLQNFPFLAVMSPFLVGDNACIAARFTHHNSVRNIWQNEWKIACQRGAYPFNEGADFGDFEPIFQELIEV